MNTLQVLRRQLLGAQHQVLVLETELIGYRKGAKNMKYIIIGILVGAVYLTIASGYFNLNKTSCAFTKGTVSK